MKGINDLKDIGKIYNAGEARSIKRGDLYYIRNTDRVVGSEQSGSRPAVVIGNDVGNEKSSVVIVVYATAQGKKELPTHVDIDSLPQKSTLLCEQIVTVSKDRIGNYAGRVTNDEMARIDKALAISIDLKKYAVRTEAETFDADGSELLEKAKSRVDQIVGAAKRIIQTENILLAAKNSTAICFSGEGIVRLDDVISADQAEELRNFAIKQIETGMAAGERELEDLLGLIKIAAPVDIPDSGQDQEEAPQTVEKAPPKVEKAQKVKKAQKSKLDTGKIKALKKAGWNVKDIADEMGCSKATVYRLLEQD